MTAQAGNRIVRDAGIGSRLFNRFGPPVLRAAQWLWPVPRLPGMRVATRYDEVIEVFRRDDVFDTPYRDHILVLTGGEPFFLGLRDGPEYRAGRAAMREVMRADDIPALADRAEALAREVVSNSQGTLEVAHDLVRFVTFRLYAEYLGIPENGRLDLWATRLFEFQFVGSPKDRNLRNQVDTIGPLFRSLIDNEIARRKEAGNADTDVLGRCIDRQKTDPVFSDVFIRTNLLCMMVGGPPQPPMVVPQALEQLLRRPDALALAQTAAARQDRGLLWKVLREAMRFDPLALGLPRVANRDVRIATGRGGGVRLAKGTKVLAAISSAMMDPRRIEDPWAFDPHRPERDYIHFGHGLHECFARAINEETLPAILIPLLQQQNLRRGFGRSGRLRKDGIFAESLTVRFDGTGRVRGLSRESPEEEP